MPTTRRRPSPLVRKIRDRAITGKGASTKLRAEDLSINGQRFEYLQLPADTTKSTIAMAFSPDGELVASTHGDHTVKITRFLDGKVLQTLRGHSRTPWTVKFHPNDSRIVASGCLGYEVRVWNTMNGQCLHVATLEAAIISLSFHPSGNIIAIASGPLVYLWDYNNVEHPFAEWVHPHALRCVRFTPDGKHIIIGAANDNPGPRRNSATNGLARGSASASGTPQVTFCLSLWDFRLEAAVKEDRTAFTRPRVLLDHALLYNDGGFDVSHDGLWLCAIAELWKVMSEPVAVGSNSTHPVRSRQREGDAAPSSISPAAADPPVETTTGTSHRRRPRDSRQTERADEMAEINDRASEGARVERSSGQGIRQATAVSCSLRSEVQLERLVAPPPISHDARVRYVETDKEVPEEPGSVPVSTGQEICFENRESGHAPGAAEQARPAGNEAGCEEARGGDPIEGATDGSRDGVKPCSSPSVAESSIPSRVTDATKLGSEGMAPMATVQGSGKLQSGRCGAGYGGGMAALKPWPRHLKLWGSSTSTRRDREGELDSAAGTNSRHPAVGVGTGGVGGGGDAPRTPSPRITVKRRLSASWLNGSGGRRSGERRGKSFSRTSFANRKGPLKCSGGGSVEAQAEKTLVEQPSLPPLPSSEESKGRSPSATEDGRAGNDPPEVVPGNDSLAPQLLASSLASEGAVGEKSARSPPPDDAASQQQPARAETPSSEVLMQGVQSQENGAGQPPLFFLKVPMAGDRREDATPEPIAAVINDGTGGHKPAGAHEGILNGPTTVDETETSVREPDLSPANVEARRESANGTTQDSSEGGAPRSRHNVDDEASIGIRSRPTGAPGPSGSAATALPDDPKGRFVPHLVLVSLHADKDEGRQATVVRAAAMDRLNAKQVTSVKLSPSSRYILLGAGSRRGRSFLEGTRDELLGDGVRGVHAPNGHGAGFASRWPHMTTSIYRAIDLKPVNMMPQVDKDVNIAIFHPEPGMGCVYGTKQGMMCIVRMGD